jgi:cytoskeleton protein RodZ
MSRPQQPGTPGIGTALKDARRRVGMDVKEAEERTKIRARYLRALEAEDWEVLPAPAYVRGFLRTYGQLLGLDGEALADEFRRYYEEPAFSVAPEPVIRERRRAPGARPPSRGPLIAAIAVGIIVLLVILGTLGGGSDPAPSGDGAHQGKLAGKGRKGHGSPALVPVDVTVDPLDAVRVCLVGDADQALIDGQMLTVGAPEQFSQNKSYRLDIDGGGVVKLTAGDESQKLKAPGNASFEADSRGIREVPYAGPDCP